MKIPRQIKDQTRYIASVILIIGTFIVISFMTNEADKAADISTVEIYLVK